MGDRRGSSAARSLPKRVRRRRILGKLSAASLRRRAALYLMHRGILRTPATLWCPGCGMETRNLRKARNHECEDSRAARRRIRREDRKGRAVAV